jgi:hypothetical protein
VAKWKEKHKRHRLSNSKQHISWTHHWFFYNLVHFPSFILIILLKKYIDSAVHTNMYVVHQGRYIFVSMFVVCIYRGSMHANKDAIVIENDFHISSPLSYGGQFPIG